MSFWLMVKKENKGWPEANEREEGLKGDNDGLSGECLAMSLANADAAVVWTFQEICHGWHKVKEQMKKELDEMEREVILIIYTFTW